MLLLDRKIGKQPGFTIVELLIVIVVIGILAAITIVAYNGIQDRARISVSAADITNASKKASLSKAINGTNVVTIDLLSGDNAISIGKGIHRVFSVCANPSGDFVVAAELMNGNIYYSRNGNPIVNDNSLNSVNPCSSLSVSSANTVYGGMPSTTCAIQGGSCSFSGTQTIAYGSPERGQFIARRNQSSPVDCSNVYFGDPSVGYQKWCYVLQY